jgi:hypothetical protein
MTHVLGVLGILLVLGMVAWCLMPRRRPKPEQRDDVARVRERVEAVLKADADYVDDRVSVIREMPGVWSISIEGTMLSRTARSPEQASRIIDEHLRRPRRERGHAVGRPRPSRATLVDWRRDIVP